MSGACWKHVRNALHARFVCLVYIYIHSCRLLGVPAGLGSKDFLNMLKNFLEAWCVSGVCLICFQSVPCSLHVRRKKWCVGMHYLSLSFK